MHALGLAGESGGFVAQQMGEAGAADALQHLLDRHAGIEGHGSAWTAGGAQRRPSTSR